MRPQLLFILIFLLAFTHATAQDTLSSPPIKKSIFHYSETDPIYALDFGGGIGGGTGLLHVGLAANADVYHILFGFHTTTSIAFKEQISHSMFLLGYRFRTHRFMIAAGSGYGWQRFKCTSGMNYDCYQYNEERIRAIPANFQADVILSDYFALGLNFQQTFSKREKVAGVLFNVKFGAFRDY